MKTALVLDLILVIFSVGAVSVAIQFAMTYLFIAALFLVFFFFELRGNGSAYLVSSIFSFALILFVGSNVTSQGMTLSSNQIWDIMLSMILFSLNSLEGFKSYLQSRGPSNRERR